STNPIPPRLTLSLRKMQAFIWYPAAVVWTLERDAADCTPRPRKPRFASGQRWNSFWIKTGALVRNRLVTGRIQLKGLPVNKIPMLLCGSVLFAVLSVVAGSQPGIAAELVDKAPPDAMKLTAEDYVEIQQLAIRYAWTLDHCTNGGYDYAD